MSGYTAQSIVRLTVDPGVASFFLFFFCVFFLRGGGGGGGGGEGGWGVGEVTALSRIFHLYRPIVHQRWAKTGEPGENHLILSFSVSRTWLSHM